MRLFPKTIDVLQEAGVDLPIDGYRNGVQRLKGPTISASWPIIPSVGTSIITSAGVRAIPYPNSSDSSFYFGLRNQIAEVISEDVRKKHEDRITFFYNHNCTVCFCARSQSCVYSVCFQEILFDEKQLLLEDSDGNVVKEDYDLLIAADGVNSIVRRKLQDYDSTYEIESFAHSCVYSVIRDLSGLDDKGIPFLRQLRWYVKNDYRGSHESDEAWNADVRG